MNIKLKRLLPHLIAVNLAASVVLLGVYVSGVTEKPTDAFEDFRVGNYLVAEVKRTGECRVALFVGKVLLQADMDAMSCTVVKRGIPDSKRATRGRKLIAMLRQ